MAFRPRLSRGLVYASLSLGVAGWLGPRTLQHSVGELPEGGFTLPTNQTITPLGLVRKIDGARPKDMAVSPDGSQVAVLCTSRLVIFDADGNQVEKLTITAGPLGVAWAPDGTIYASSTRGRIMHFTHADGQWAAGRTLSVEAKDEKAPAGQPVDPQVAGLAISPDGRKLYAALGIRNAIAVIDLITRQRTDLIPVGVCPYNVLLTPNGRTLYVACRGGRADAKGPSAISAGTPVRVERDTDAALNGAIAVVDTNSLTVDQIEVGRQPAGMALLPDDRLAVTESDQDTVGIVDLNKRRVQQHVSVRPPDDPGFGQIPTACLLSGSGAHLYVACGGANAVAVVNTADMKVAGYLPTGWYPVAIAMRDRKLFVASAKGIGARPEAHAKGYGVHASVGTFQVVSRDERQDLTEPSRRVAENNHWRAGVADTPAEAAAVPVPARVGEPSVFKHVVYIIKENHTYDQDLGDMPQGNGDKSLCIFGEDVTPNEHKLAREFALLDNTYTSGTNSADGHQWVASAVANGYIEQNYSAHARSYPYDGGDPLAYSPAGFLWTQARRHKVSARVYGEFVNRPKIALAKGSQNGAGSAPAPTDGGKVLDPDTGAPLKITWRMLWQDYQAGGHKFEMTAATDNAALRPLLHPHYIGFPTVVSDQWRADTFLADLKQFEAKGDMPAFSMLLLPNDHTVGIRAGFPTPRAQVADNDLALGRIVEGISRSKFWKDTLILVIEDDSQMAVDHVDGHRTVAQVISAYTRRGAVVSQPYNHTSFARTIELVLGLPPMNRFDRTATPLTACFTNTADLTPYTHADNVVPLDEMNPAAAKLTGEARRLANASMRQDVSQLDRADPTVISRAAWAMAKTGRPFPQRHFHPPATRDADD